MSRRVGIAVLAAVPLVTLGLALPASASPSPHVTAPAATTTQNFGYSTAGARTFTVPGGVAFLNVTLDGGTGGVGDPCPSFSNPPEGAAAAGGAGGEVTGTLPVVPGEQLGFFVGQVGSNGVTDTAGGTGDTLPSGSLSGGQVDQPDCRGGGGGGATDLYEINADSSHTLVAVAGGGGGGGGGEEGVISFFPGGDGGVGFGINGQAGAGNGSGAGGAGGGGNPNATALGGGGREGAGGGGYTQPGSAGSPGSGGDGGGGGGGGGDSWTGGKPNVAPGTGPLIFDQIGPSSLGAGSNGAVTIAYQTPSTQAFASANPSTSSMGQPVSYSATFQDNAGVSTPTGTVTFSVGGSQLCTATLAPDSVTFAAGTGTCRSAGAPQGNDTVLASYSGDQTFGPSSVQLFQTVNPPPITTVTASPATASERDLVTYTASVRAGSGTTIPTGSVTFMVGDVPLCNHAIQLTASGEAKCATPDTPVGVNSVTAIYSGDATSAGSSGSVIETVAARTVPLDTVIGVGVDPASSTQGAPVTYVGDVRAATGTAVPTGTVTFTVGTTRLCAPVTLNDVANAKCTSSKAPIGVDTVTATYSGAAIFNSTTGQTTETVTAAATG